MEIKKLVQSNQLACNLCEGYGVTIVQEKGKADILERCVKCYATGLRIFPESTK